MILITLLLTLSTAHSAEMTDMAFVPIEACKGQITENTEEISRDQLITIYQAVGSRSDRTSHALWHAMRYGYSPQDKNEIVKNYGEDWGKEHPLCGAAHTQIGANYNPAGEDFLYMHRGMIGQVRGALIGANQKCIQGWNTIPDPRQIPFPKDEDEDVNSGPKSMGGYQQLQRWDWYFQSPDEGAVKWRQNISLSQFGFALEFSIHNNLHQRYATARPAGPFRAVKPQDDGANIPLDGNFPKDWIYDQSGYNWLNDPYGAAVNPFFWRIHGYVDRLVDVWLRDNGKNRIEEPGQCHGDPTCYEWKGMWTGSNLYIDPPPSLTSMFSMKGALADHPSPRDADFKRRRMALSNLGVIGKNQKMKSPPPGNGPSQEMDPLQYVTSSICGR